jgi:transcription initiation factor TFIID subunit 5
VQAEHTINSMAVSDDVQWLAVGTASSCVQLYDLQKQPQAQPAGSTSEPWEESLDEGDCVKYMWGHEGPVYGLAFNCDRRLLYSCGFDGTVRLWVTSMGANTMIWRSHLLPVWDIAACPTGHWFATGGADWIMSLW